MSGLHIWVMAARPRTLPAAIAPVLVGSAAAAPLTGPDQLVTDYRAFLDEGRTPARVVARIVAAYEKAGVGANRTPSQK